MKSNQHLLSHLVTEDIKSTLEESRKRIVAEGDKPHVSVSQQLELLEELSSFDLGRFLLKTRGLNGYWTDYCVTHPFTGKQTGRNNRGDSFSTLERFILEKSPSMLATQERFVLFQKICQKEVKNGAILASIPCGMMRELLYLDFNHIDDIELVGVDHDAAAISLAKQLAKKQRLSQYVRFLEKDAWNLGINSAYHLIVSNGLNIYESDNDKLVKLYNHFYQALKPSGKLVTSFLTYPPHRSDHSEWVMGKVNQDDLLLQRIVFQDLIQTRWQCYRSAEQIESQLKAAGFEEISFIYDICRIFPTVIATK